MTPYRIETLQNGIPIGESSVLKQGEKKTVDLAGERIKVMCTKKKHDRGHHVKEGEITFPVEKIDVCEHIVGKHYTQPFKSSPVAMHGGEFILTKKEDANNNKEKDTQILRIIYISG